MMPAVSEIAITRRSMVLRLVAVRRRPPCIHRVHLLAARRPGKSGLVERMRRARTIPGVHARRRHNTVSREVRGRAGSRDRRMAAVDRREQRAVVSGGVLVMHLEVGWRYMMVVRCRQFAGRWSRRYTTVTAVEAGVRHRCSVDH